MSGRTTKSSCLKSIATTTVVACLSISIGSFLLIYGNRFRFSYATTTKEIKKTRTLLSKPDERRRRRRTSSQELLPTEQISMAKHHPRKGGKYGLAYEESMGFFDDIPNDTWMRMKEHVKDFYNEHDTPNDPMKHSNSPNIWYQLNWEPNFSCAHERRVGSIGGRGDGETGKWLCNPHRIPEVTKLRQEAGGNNCLVYSIGAAGGGSVSGRFGFEYAIQDLLGKNTCEIHIFDSTKNHFERIRDNIQIHPWGLVSSSKDDFSSKKKKENGNFKSLQQTVQDLKHDGRIVDILKVDCEICVLQMYQDWFTSGLDDIRQILVQTQMVNERSNKFFETMRDEEYVIFHKEPNTSKKGNVVEYSFLKLDTEFFNFKY